VKGHECASTTRQPTPLARDVPTLSPVAESFIEKELEEQRVRNAKIVETFERHGGDVDEPRPIDFFFYANSHPDAAALGRDLEAMGFDAVYVASPDDDIGGKFPVQAVKNDTVAAVTAEEFVGRLVRLTAKYLAEFDGWGTAV
jgi:regulator of RNase E activity RraB